MSGMAPRNEFAALRSRLVGTPSRSFSSATRGGAGPHGTPPVREEVGARPRFLDVAASDPEMGGTESMKVLQSALGTSRTVISPRNEFASTSEFLRSITTGLRPRAFHSRPQALSPSGRGDAAGESSLQGRSAPWHVPDLILGDPEMNSIESIRVWKSLSYFASGDREGMAPNNEFARTTERLRDVGEGAASKLFVFVLHYFVRPQLATADDAGRLDGNSKLLSTQMATKGSHGAALEMESVARSEMQHLVAQTGPAGLQMMKERESSRQTRRLRLLGLHGWRTSGEVLTKQLAMAGWDRALGDLIEVIPMDAPHPASGPTPPDVELFFGKKQYYEWWDAERGEDGKFHFTGWAESKLAVESFLRDHGPFDGFLGFSQGGIHASSLLAMQQNGRAMEGIPPMRIAIVIASMASRDAKHQGAFDVPVRVPSIHVYGQADPLKRGSLVLASLYEDPLVISHPGGHKIPPLKGEDLDNVRQLLQAVAAPQPVSAL